MADEKYLDAHNNLIEEGIYTNRDSGGFFRVKKGERGEFILIDSLLNREYAMAGHIAFNLRPIRNPEQEVKSLRKNADWLESQLEELAQSTQKRKESSDMEK